MSRKRNDYVTVSAFRRHPKIDDETLIRLVYYFCNGMPIASVAKTLGLSRKSVRAHYMALRSRLLKPKFRRWHSLFNAIATMADEEEVRRVRGTFLELMASCYYSPCYGNYDSGNRKTRICRKCPLKAAFSEAEKVNASIKAIDAISAFYRTLGIRNDTSPDKQTVFLERFIHASVISYLQEKAWKQPNGMLDPADTEYEGMGTLLQMIMDDLANDNAESMPTDTLHRSK